MHLSDPRGLRRVAGATMVVAPPVFVIAELLHANFQTEAAKQVTAVADKHRPWGFGCSDSQILNGSPIA